MNKYLISSEKRVQAVIISDSLGLRRCEWAWIPFERNKRRGKLCGRRVKEEKYLIGSFETHEREYLGLT